MNSTSPQFIGCYGDSNASTPVINNLAEEGGTFISFMESHQSRTMTIRGNFFSGQHQNKPGFLPEELVT